MHRRALLDDLLSHRRPVREILVDLRPYGWDADEPLVSLTADHLLDVLRQFCRDEVSATEIEAWANAIECRDEIGYGPESATGEILHQLANPEISNPISHEWAWTLIDRLKASGEVVPTPHFMADITLLTSDAGGRKIPLSGGEWRTVLDLDGRKWSALLQYDGEPAPGDSFVAGVILLYVEKALPGFTLGAEFTVWEGGTKATGRVRSLASK